MSGFLFRKIKRNADGTWNMTAKEAEMQYVELQRLDLQPDGTYDPDAPNAFDSVRVGEAMETGILPTRREVRARVEAKARASANMTDAECREYFINTILRPPQ